MKRKRSFWLMKSEPSVFSIEDLRKAKNQTVFWDGVRNYQARNLLRDAIRRGDGILFYHSSAKPTGIAGEARVVRAGSPDPTAFDPSDLHFDPGSRPDHPRWYGVDVEFVRSCNKIITPERLRSIPALKNLMVLRKGMRLSVQPVQPEEWGAILNMPEWG
jgi:predicted RNA-binding protein with PUA-like domain